MSSKRPRLSNRTRPRTVRSRVGSARAGRLLALGVLFAAAGCASPRGAPASHLEALRALDAEPPASRAIAALDRLKLLALPQGALLPGCAVPLVVFEPGYRAMVEDALAGDRLLAVAMLAPGAERDPEARPKLRPTACLAMLEDAETLPGGRFRIAVRGLLRIRIAGEPRTDRPYREVVAQIDDEEPEADSRDLQTLHRSVSQLWGLLPRPRRQALLAASTAGLDPGNLCDAMAAAVLDEPEELQSILETFEVRARVRRLTGLVGGRLLSVQPRPYDGLLS